MITQALKKLRKKEPTTQENNSPEDKNKVKWKAIFDKYIDYVDNILGLVSLWVAAIVCILYQSSLPELHLPFFLDEILFFILIYILADITLNQLRPVVFIALAVGIFYLLSQIALDIYQDSINPTKTENTFRIGDMEKILPAITHLSKVDPASIKELDSLHREHDKLKDSFDVLRERLQVLSVKVNKKNKTK